METIVPAILISIVLLIFAAVMIFIILMVTRNPSEYMIDADEDIKTPIKDLPNNEKFTVEVPYGGFNK